MSICPICKTRETHKKIKKIWNGYGVKKEDGTYYFKKIGREKVERVEEWWTCKKCAETVPTKLYNNLCIKFYEKKF